MITRGCNREMYPRFFSVACETYGAKPRNRKIPGMQAVRVSSRGNAYYTYGFPIVSHCRGRARPRWIPVTIGDRTMGDPSEIAGKSPLWPRPTANIVRTGRAVRGEKAEHNARGNGSVEARSAVRATNNDLPLSVRTCINHRYDVGQSSPRQHNSLEISPARANAPWRLTPDNDCLLKVYGGRRQRRNLLPITIINISDVSHRLRQSTSLSPSTEIKPAIFADEEIFG